MANLIIKKVTYNGDLYEYQSPILGKGVNIIEGDNGTGKTTFMDLIYYGLGGYVSQFRDIKEGMHKEILEDKNNYIRLDIEISGVEYSVMRFLNSNNITVIDSQDKVEVLPITRTDKVKYIFSDWLLTHLGIELIDLYYGNNYHWRLNITDLFRLIYHNQNPDPTEVYKSPDHENFLADSIFVRKVIFQVLMGKSFSQYYVQYSKMKEIEREKDASKLAYDRFNEASKAITANQDNNLVHLNQEKEDLESSLIQAYKNREQIKNNRPSSTQIDEKIDKLKASLLENNLKIENNISKRDFFSSEKIKMLKLKEDTILEATQIKKIMFTQEKLKLFSPNTCPYCLKPTTREEGKCICGNVVEEQQYEKFFYDDTDYSDILRSKQKSVETIDLAINECEINTREAEEDLHKLTSNEVQIKKAIEIIVNDMTTGIDVHALNNVDDEILDIRQKISTNSQLIEIETKRDELQIKLDELNSQYEHIKNSVTRLESESSEELSDRISQFNEVYNELMRAALNDCRSARISSDTYTPIINNSEYREASARVPIRLMYFLTLLFLSIKYNDTLYPKFLMIDNPNTSGIDLPKLRLSLEQINKIIKDAGSNDFQIILATGTNIYPEEFKNGVFTTLTVSDKLLKRKKSSLS